jgi:hypothetical protein
MSMKNSNDTFWNRTSDLPICSAAPWPLCPAALLRMRNVSEKSCRENQNTHFILSNFFPRKTCRLWEYVEKIWYSRADHRWEYGDKTLIIVKKHVCTWEKKIKRRKKLRLIFLYFLISIKPTACTVWIARYNTGLKSYKKSPFVLFQYRESEWKETIFAALKLGSADGNVVMPVVHWDDVSTVHNLCETESSFLPNDWSFCDILPLLQN